MDRPDIHVPPIEPTGSDASTSASAEHSRRFQPFYGKNKDAELKLEEMRYSTIRWRLVFYVVFSLIGIAALIGLLGVVMGVLATPVGILLWTIIFVFCLRPIVNALDRRGVSRVIGTAIAYIIMILVLVTLAVILFTPAVGVSGQFAQLVEDVPNYYASVRDWFVKFSETYSNVLETYNLTNLANNIIASAYSMLGDISKMTADGIVNIGSFIANSILVLGFALVISFWVLVGLPSIKKEIHRLAPENRRTDVNMIITTCTEVVGGYIKATLIQCFIIGTASGIGYAVIGLPSPVALGIITGLMNIIPVVGPWIGGAFAAMVGIMVGPIPALAALAWSIVVQQVVYSFISPMIMSGSVDIHPVLVFFGLMCGSAIGGAMGGLGGSIVGMLASIPLIAVGKALFVYYFEKNTGRRIVAEDGFFFKASVPEAATDTVDPAADATASVQWPDATGNLGQMVKDANLTGKIKLKDKRRD